MTKRKWRRLYRLEDLANEQIQEKILAPSVAKTQPQASLPEKQPHENPQGRR